MYWLWNSGQAQIYSFTQRAVSFALHYEQSQQNQPASKLPGLPSIHLKYLYSKVPFPTPQHSEFCQAVPSATNHFPCCFLFFFYIIIFTSDQSISIIWTCIFVVSFSFMCLQIV